MEEEEEEERLYLHLETRERVQTNEAKSKRRRAWSNGAAPNLLSLFVGVRFFCFAWNKQNLATLSGTGRESKVMAKTLRIFLYPRLFPQGFILKPAGKVCLWRKSMAAPFNCRSGTDALSHVKHSVRIPINNIYPTPTILPCERRRRMQEQGRSRSSREEEEEERLHLQLETRERVQTNEAKGLYL